MICLTGLRLRPYGAAMCIGCAGFHPIGCAAFGRFARFLACNTGGFLIVTIGSALARRLLCHSTAGFIFFAGYDVVVVTFCRNIDVTLSRAIVHALNLCFVTVCPGFARFNHIPDRASVSV